MTNNWILHVKTFANKHGVSYRSALKDPKCKASYQPTSGRGLRAIARKMHGKGAATDDQFSTEQQRLRQHLNSFMSNLIYSQMELGEWAREGERDYSHELEELRQLYTQLEDVGNRMFPNVQTTAEVHELTQYVNINIGEPFHQLVEHLRRKGFNLF